MSHLKIINPNLYNTLEFLSGMLDEPEFLGLMTELNRTRATQEKFNKRKDSSKKWNSIYLDYLGLTGRCLTENSTIPFYGKHRCIDDFIDECQEISGELNGKSVAKVIALVLNSNLNFEKKIKKVDEISYHFYWFDWEFRWHDKIPFQRGQFNDTGVESIVLMIQKSFGKSSKGKYSPKYVYDLSAGINKTEKVTSLLEKRFSHSASHEEELYFALLLGESLNPQYWVQSLEKLSFGSLNLYEREMQDCIKNNLVKKRGASVSPLIRALTSCFYGDCPAEDVPTNSGNFLKTASLLIDLFRSNLPGKYDLALTKIKPIKYLIDDSFWEPIIGDLKSAYRKKDYIVEILEKIGQPAVKPLVELLNSNHPEKFYAAKALGEIMAYERELADSSALNSLINYLSSEDPYCYYAAIALGEIRSSVAVEGLIEFLHSSHPKKSCAIPALGKIGDSRAIGPLIEYIKHEVDEFNISSAVRALSMIDYPTAREYLTDFVKQNPKYLSNLEERIGRLEDLDKLSWIDTLKEEIRGSRKEEELDIPF